MLRTVARFSNLDVEDWIDYALGKTVLSQLSTNDIKLLIHAVFSTVIAIVMTLILVG